MNHYHADVLRYALDGVLHLATTVDAVTSTTKFTLHNVTGFLPGDVIQVTVGATTVDTVIQTIVSGLLTVSPAVPAAVAHGSVVRFDLPHTIYNYKDIASGEQPTFVRPCVIVTLPKQQTTRGIPQGAHPESAIVDQTRVTIYVETPVTITSGGVARGGFDVAHHPAIRHLRNFIRNTQALDIPSALAAIWRSGTVGMKPAGYEETPARLPDAEQHLFHLVLWDFNTLSGG
jgi:hypothetical protein